MNFSKSILLTVIYSAGLLAPAIAATNSDPATFQADKDRYIANILERIQIDQKNLSCVQTAQDHAALNACDVTVKQGPDSVEPEIKAPVADKKVETPVADKKAPIADKKIQKGTKNKARNNVYSD